MLTACTGDERAVTQSAFPSIYATSGTRVLQHYLPTRCSYMYDGHVTFFWKNLNRLVLVVRSGAVSVRYKLDFLIKQ